MLLAKMCEIAAAMSVAVMLKRVVVGSASRRSSGEMEMVVALSPIVAETIDGYNIRDGSNRIHCDFQAIESSRVVQNQMT